MAQIFFVGKYIVSWFKWKFYEFIIYLLKNGEKKGEEVFVSNKNKIKGRTKYAHAMQVVHQTENSQWNSNSSSLKTQGNK